MNPAATASAYEHCRRLARASGSSFYTGMRLLPPDRRGALFAVYALARLIDDVADGELDPAAKLARLAQMRGLLARIDSSDDPVLVAVSDASRRFPIPLEAFDDLIDGAELDVLETECATFADLERYARCVAGSIGRLALGVFDCSDRERGAVLADDLGVALQLGNTLRDVSEDLANGRVYLPREDLERFGCAVVGGSFVGPIEFVIAFGAQRGLSRLDRALALVPLLDRRSAACVLAMAGKYRRLLERIAVDPSLALHGRLSLRRWEKGLVLAQSLIGAERLSARGTGAGRHEAPAREAGRWRGAGDEVSFQRPPGGAANGEPGGSHDDDLVRPSPRHGDERRVFGRREAR